MARGARKDGQRYPLLRVIPGHKDPGTLAPATPQGPVETNTEGSGPGGLGSWTQGPQEPKRSRIREPTTQGMGPQGPMS